ncbi:MAG: TetR/AcrR family transcriptional regulator [Pseudomonadota bacterium]
MTTRRQSKTLVAKKTQRPRDPDKTKAGILQAAIYEFAKHGYYGARIASVSKAARCNPRMIYHYFGGKEALYVAALENVYAAIRSKEAALSLSEDDPVDGIRRLVAFTFDYFRDNPVFLHITRNENILGGRFIRKSQTIRSMSQPLTETIGHLLDSGIASGRFRYRLDPLQLYLSVVALSAHHINNSATLSATFGADLTDPDWEAERRLHVETMVLRNLGADIGLDEAASKQDP